VITKAVSLNLPDNDIAVVPYDSDGKLDKNSRMIFDLRENAKIRVPIEGAMNGGCLGYMYRKKHGHYQVVIHEKMGPCVRVLGAWWIAEAIAGVLAQLPIVPQNPTFVDKEEDLSSSVEELSKSSDSLRKSSTAIAKGLKLPDKLIVEQGHITRTDRDFGDNIHEWRIRLNADSAKFVEKVEWRLHKTFRDPLVACEEAPFGIMRVGWGTFTVHFKIYLKEDGSGDAPRVLEGSHYLVFEGEDEVVATTEVPTPKPNSTEDSSK